MVTRSLRRVGALTLLMGAFVVSGCGDATGPDFDRVLGVDLTRMTKSGSGLYYEDLTVGTGATATSGASATVRYSGWLENGRQFDTGSYTFRLSSGEAIAGFDEGVLGMRVGGTRRIVVPPSLGYGDTGIGPIPPNAWLLFDLELLSVEP
jgi:FKBP-type peptidyl-prolyl cis-trans isomerase FkpA